MADDEIAIAEDRGLARRGGLRRVIELELEPLAGAGSGHLPAAADPAGERAGAIADP